MKRTPFSLALVFLLALGIASGQQSSSSKKNTNPSHPNLPVTQTRLTLDTSETLFSVLTAINTCGYDQDLNIADPVRLRVREEVARNIQISMEAQQARDKMCRFFRDKMQPDASRDLAQYVSLALNMTEAPQFGLTIREADLPLDAGNVSGFPPLLQRFYDAAGLHQLWQKNAGFYEREIASMQQPVNQMLLRTDLYLKNPFSSYLGRKFIVYVEPMGANSQVNARNYQDDYYMVISPGQTPINFDRLRHTYLHFMLDSITLKKATLLKKLEPLLDSAQTALIDDSYKHDVSLMVTESLIRAIEARNVTIEAKDPKLLEEQRAKAATTAMKAGYILTQYFYDELVKFEKEPTALRDAMSDMLYNISVDRERKRLEDITFAKESSEDPMTGTRQRASLLDLAEERLKTDPQAAHRIAQQALDQKSGEPGRALFILGRAAILEKDRDGSLVFFERALQASKEPRTIAWSHIYLGRIQDLMCNRELAVSHYKAAQTSGDEGTDTKAAIERGLKEGAPDCGKDQ